MLEKINERINEYCKQNWIKKIFFLEKYFKKSQSWYDLMSKWYIRQYKKTEEVLSKIDDFLSSHWI